MVMLAVSVVVLGGCAAQGGGSDPVGSTSAPAPVLSAPGPSETGPAVSIPSSLGKRERVAAERAVAAYTGFEGALDAARHDPPGLIDSLDSVALFGALTEAKLEIAQMIEEGSHKEGPLGLTHVTVKSVSLETNKADRIVPVVEVSSCISLVGSRFIDARGKVYDRSGLPDYFPSTAWVGYYPKQKAGMDGWVVTRVVGKGAEKC